MFFEFVVAHVSPCWLNKESIHGFVVVNGMLRAIEVIEYPFFCGWVLATKRPLKDNCTKEHMIKYSKYFLKGNTRPNINIILVYPPHP